MARRAFNQQRDAVSIIAAWVRGRKIRKWWKAKVEGARLLQNYFRMWMEKRLLEEDQVMHEMRKAAILITAAAKGYLVRKRYRKCFKKYVIPTIV